MSPLQAPIAGCNSSSRDMASISTEHTCTNPYSDMYVYMYTYTFINYYFMRGCFTYMYICAPMGMPDPWGPEESVGSPGTRVRDDYKIPCECWESNSRSPGKAASSLNC